MNLSVRSEASNCPKELYGFVYDIPKDSKLTNVELTQIFLDQHIQCQAQISRDESKPFYMARIKFNNSVHLEVATKTLRCFKLQTEHGKDRICRFLPYVETLNRNPEVLDMVCLDNLPDNSHQQTNLCVKGLDECLTEEDLHLMFQKFGEIRSVKVAKKSDSSQSLGYGFVWFAEEYACMAALAAWPEHLGYECELY